ncbi:hypothetical protein PGTUg99_007154 [Puccinia graminis f. sp. tritici]|uniref:Uncharacterized protein n=1 Tax=Puccinia graminis f. sp. tritici TaxID=56615 RepID=A0A5B0SIZ9_PUCGR|nr:hypothetical protein PGTUg99_007154 [Puccinia graminis f. sp. tritici]
MAVKPANKRRSIIQVGSPLLASPVKPTRDNNRDHPPIKPSPQQPEPTKAINPLKKKRLSASRTIMNNQRRDAGAVGVETHKKRAGNALVEHLKERDAAKILRIKTHLNLINSFNLLLNLSRLTLLSFNSHTITHPHPQTHNQTGHLTTDDDPNQDKRLKEDEELEASFYHLALFCFELWLGRIADYLPQSLYKLKRPDQKSNPHLIKKDDYEIELTVDYLPPLDVLFVWYSYCLNSRNYYEDGLRLYPILKHLRFPLELAAAEYDLFCPKTNVQKLGPASQIGEEETGELLRKIKQLSDPAHSCVNFKDDKHLRDPSVLLGLLSPKSFDSPAGSHSRKLWTSLTNTDFNLIRFINQPSLRTFICPQCDDTLESPFYVKDKQTNTVKVTDSCWSYSGPKAHKSQHKPTSTSVQQDDQGAAFAQEESPRNHLDNSRGAHPAGSHKNHAKLRCTNCNWTGIKQDLSLFKYASEFKFSSANLWLKSASSHPTQDAVNCLAGTLTTLDDLNDTKNAIKFNGLFLKEKTDLVNALHERGQDEHHQSDVDRCLDHLNHIRHSLDLKILNNKLVPTRERIKIKNCFQNLLKSYSVPEPFSVDLIRSMKLETFFITKMVDLGWTEINDPLSATTAANSIAKSELDGRLQSCLSRYNAFSSLVSTIDPLQVLIPTFDIDLAWKTDRLRGVEYTESMMQYNKNLINHPNELDLDKSKYLAHFRLTSALWISRYHIGYSRYPAPFVKVDRRQDWLKKAIRELALPVESISVRKDSSQADSLRKQSTSSSATNRSPVSSSTTCSVDMPDKSQAVEEQKAATKSPIIPSFERGSTLPKYEVNNNDHREGLSGQNDDSEGDSSKESIGKYSDKGKQFVKDTDNEDHSSAIVTKDLRDSVQVQPPMTDSKLEPAQPHTQADNRCFDDDQSKEIKSEYADKGKQVAQPEDEGSDSSSMATKYSKESIILSDTSPGQPVDQRASQQYARKIFLEYTRPTSINPADYTRKQEGVAAIPSVLRPSHFSHEFGTQSIKIPSDFSASSNQKKTEITYEHPKRDTIQFELPPNQPANHCDGQAGWKKKDRSSTGSNVARDPSLDVAGSSQNAWRGAHREDYSLPVPTLSPEIQSARQPAREASLPIHLTQPHLQSHRAARKTTAAASPGLRSPPPSRPPFSPSRPPLTKSKLKATDIGDELFDNNFVIPIGKIAFVEEVDSHYDDNTLRALNVTN